MNIIQMDDYGKSRKGPGESTRLLRECRSRSMKRLTASVRSMLDKVDDALFDLAEKAESNAVQSLYFDAMREVRLKRQAIEEAFRSTFGEGFDHAMDGRAQNNAAPEADSELGLSLVETDELEESLAVTNMVGKVKSTCKEQLGHLDTRVGVLLDDPELKSHSNPVGPEVVCNAFAEACNVIESGVKVKLIILKLFDRYVLCDLPAVYQELNQFLIENGVLPKIRVAVKKRPGAAAPGPAYGAGTSDSAWDGEDEAGQDVFGTMQQLWTQGPGGGASGVSGYGGAPGAGAAGSVQGGGGYGGGIPAALTGLTLLQQGYPGAVGGGLPVDGAVVASGTTNVVRQLKGASLGEEAGPVDDMTIDIVAMLFDYILDDKDIPGAMKALIGRLQIPVLKVVLIDKSFFARKGHPARRLVNRLAEAALGWDGGEGDDDPLYRKMSTVVQRVLDEFEDDIELFAELLADFEQFVAQEAEQADEQVSRAIEGRERLGHAKEMAQEEIDQRTESDEVRGVVKTFLTTHWNSLLFVLCAREGADSEAYRGAIETMDDLIWSIAPKHSAADRKRLVSLLPSLLRRLKEGMGLISVAPEVRERFLAVLAEYHAAAVNVGRSAGQGGALGGDDVADAVEAAARDGSAAGDDGAIAGEEAAGEKLEQGFNADAIRELLADTGLDVEEITLSEEPESLAEAENDDDFMDQARNLPVGSWLEYVEEDGSTLRARLTWISRVTGTYLFTNRKGLKARDMTVHGLAAALRRGSATVLEDVPLLDRAVGNLMEGLRKSAAG